MEDEEDDQAMLSMMGFASFGAQKPPSKKRRYNPNADASVADASSSTGANSMPLGPPRVPIAATNTNEINLDDDDDANDDNEQDNGASIEVIGRATSKSIPEDLSASISTLPRPEGLPQRPAPVSDIHYNHGSGAHNHSANQHHNKQDESQGKPWYDGYYDYHSIENPWEKLERTLGLNPIDEWMAKPNKSAA